MHAQLPTLLTQQKHSCMLRYTRAGNISGKYTLTTQLHGHVTAEVLSADGDAAPGHVM